MKPKQNRICGLLVVFVAGLVLGVQFPAALLAQGVPERMNYQGLLLSGQGAPITAPTDVEFRIWDTPSLTDPSGLKWGRSFRVTPDANGLFNAVLSNDGTLLPGAPNVSLSSVFTGTNSTARHLELTVAGATAIRPRQQFLAAPYSFQSGGAVPIGGIIMWSGSVTSVPPGWALCDGSTYGGVATPDLRGRFVLGAGQGTNLTERVAGTSGGEEAHTLTIAEMPSHTHTNTFLNDGHPDGWGNRSGNQFIMDPSWFGTTKQFSSTANGGGAPHANMPPFYVLAYIMRLQ